jgi:hypothetical protein
MQQEYLTWPIKNAPAYEQMCIVKISEHFKKYINLLNDRVVSLESQTQQLIQRNQMLEGELNDIKQSINQPRQNSELEEYNPTKDVVNILTELELKITNIIKENGVEQLSDHILIGFKDNETVPVFVHKNSDYKGIFKIRNTCPVASHNNPWGGSVIIINSLKHLKNITTYDIHTFQHIKIIDNNSGNVIYDPDKMDDGYRDGFGKKIIQNNKYLTPEELSHERNLKILKKLLSVLDEMGIELTMCDSYTLKSGVSIRTLIEKI